jgi:hypothetical protein
MTETLKLIMVVVKSHQTPVDVIIYQKGMQTSIIKFGGG